MMSNKSLLIPTLGAALLSNNDRYFMTKKLINKNLEANELKKCLFCKK